jgi:hypothetical protein
LKKSTGKAERRTCYDSDCRAGEEAVPQQDLIQRPRDWRVARDMRAK